MDVHDFLNEVDELGNYEIEHNMVPLIPEPPRQRIYLRDITNPFEFYTENQFKDRYRFTKNTVQTAIMPLLREGVHHSSRGLPISLEMQATIALQYYATGSFQVTTGDLHYITQPTVSRIVKHVSHQLASKVNEYVRFPDNLQRVAQQFENVQARYAGLRHIIGAIDCTHIKINRPRGLQHSEIYRNRKGSFSINVQAVVGQDMKFYDIVTRWPGSIHDSRVFRNSRLHARLESGNLRGILVGDSGYRSTTYMLTPFINPNTRPQNHYNYVQVRTRNVVERTFGAIKKRFECLRRGIGTKLTTASAVVAACAVLHNIARDYNEELYEDPDYIEPEPIPVTRNTVSGLAFRNNIVRQYYS